MLAPRLSPINVATNPRSAAGAAIKCSPFRIPTRTPVIAQPCIPCTPLQPPSSLLISSQTRNVSLQSAPTPPPATETPSLGQTALVPVLERGEMSVYPSTPGVYAVFDKEGTLQYIGLSRKVSSSVANHMAELTDLTHAVKVLPLPNASRESLTAAWKSWIEEAVSETGNIPPGNSPGESKWQSRSAKAAKPEIKLTAGKPISGVTIADLVDAVVKGNRVVAFIKGTRTQPQCGFSFKVLTILNESRADFEVVNVLDDIHNPGLRDVIKTYSQWPTIPQVYVEGEFVGGADIIEQMQKSGELAKVLKKA